MMAWPDRGGSQRVAADVGMLSQNQNHIDPSQNPNQHQNRNQFPNQHNQHFLAPQQAGSSGARYRSTSRVSEIDVWDNMQNHHLQGDSSSSDEGIHPRRRHPPRTHHTRSVSNPFPSLFFGRKKKTSTVAADDDDDDDDSSSDSAAGGSRFSGKPPATRGHSRNASSIGPRDFATGRCMTCGSLVRWPRDLQLFRCTICMTVNDLQPVADRPAGPGGPSDVAVAFEDQPEPKDRPISLGHTRSLAEQCLRSFLASVVKKTQAGGGAVQEDAAGPPSLPTQPGQARAPAPPSAAPLTLRPKMSLDFEPRLAPAAPRHPGMHRRAPSWAGTSPGSYPASIPEGRPPPPRTPAGPGAAGGQTPAPRPGDAAKRIFRPLEDYIVACFTSFSCLNSSFLAPRSRRHGSHAGESRPRRPSEHVGRRREARSTSYPVPDLDPKLLLLGDFAENGSWWTGQEEVLPHRTPSSRSHHAPSMVSPRSPHVDWAELEEWYAAALEPARLWSGIYESIVARDPALALSPAAMRDVEAQILAGQEHAQRVLLKVSEAILKRPGRRITEPQELRFLLIITANPLLHASYKPYAGRLQPPSAAPARSSGPTSGRHSVVIKRIVGLMSNAPAECHNYLVNWFARYPEAAFVQTKELVSGFLTYRLIRQNEKKYQAQFDLTGGLVPNMGSSPSTATLHAALGGTGSSGTQRSKKQREKKKKVVYQEDWQIRAAAQVLGLLFAANNMGHVRRGRFASSSSSPDSPGGRRRRRELVHAPGQILATSDFYVTLLDDSDLVADFDAWERRQGRFAFCQHPFLLSIGAKIQILEHDARRQMENKARDAFFDSIMSNRVVQQFLVLSIRRDCLVEDSLKAVSEVIGAGGEDIKKALRINFRGEEGVDAGGLRKEWFLLLVREVFNPDHGLFLYDEDSHYCYFNPNALEPSEQFFLVGVVLGLAIYNSTILDIALPPFAFRKLLAAAPPPRSPSPSSQPPGGGAGAGAGYTPTLDDLAEYRPRLAHGLRQLLAYEGDDVESVFGLVFAVDADRYGAVDSIPLCPNGASRPVTAANRREYVDAYVHHALASSVTRQFEPFKRGFFTVVTSDALSLFRPEEIELLVRGAGNADAPLDIQALRAVAVYDGWHSGTGPNPAGNNSNNSNNNNSNNSNNNNSNNSNSNGGNTPPTPEDEPTIQWFWNAWETATPQDQRRLLAFITGSDRVPAVGAASLAIRVSCLGDECGRFPTARTCFNSIGLWRVRVGGTGTEVGTGSAGEGEKEAGGEEWRRERERFESVLWRAVRESEGFGLK